MRAWEEFLAKQEKEIGKSAVDKWLRPLKIVRFDACNLYLESADSFRLAWFEEHIRPKVERELFNNNHKLIKTHLQVTTEQKPPSIKKKTSLAHTPSLSFTLKFDALDPDSTFERFIPTEGSMLSYKLLADLINTQDAELQFNPIYLYGRSGTGKTHLMMATANALIKKGKKALYVRAQTFTDHVVGAIRTAEMQTFRKAYRGVDVLIVDDLEVFSRKGATQEEFFHTFNTLHVEGKQIILSAAVAPQELKFIEPRLISRFEWGIALPLYIATKEEMRSILLQKATKLSFPLPEPVILFLLDTFGSSAKSLMRALDALILRTHLNLGLGTARPASLSLDAAQKTLQDLIQEEEKSVLTPGKIIRTVADYYGIRIDDILSKSQARESALPRQIAMHLCRHQLNLPFMKIGDIFSRDHSTVMASVKQVQTSLENKTPEILSSINSILKILVP